MQSFCICSVLDTSWHRLIHGESESSMCVILLSFIVCSHAELLRWHDVCEHCYLHSCSLDRYGAQTKCKPNHTFVPMHNCPSSPTTQDHVCSLPWILVAATHVWSQFIQFAHHTMHVSTCISCSMACRWPRQGSQSRPCPASTRLPGCPRSAS